MSSEAFLENAWAKILRVLLVHGIELIGAKRMKIEDNLKALLRAWQPELPERADFSRAVWRKIEASNTSALPSWAEIIFMSIVRPRVAAGAVAFALLLGGVAGVQIARANQTTAYLRSVHPYAQLR